MRSHSVAWVGVLAALAFRCGDNTSSPPTPDAGAGDASSVDAARLDASPPDAAISDGGGGDGGAFLGGGTLALTISFQAGTMPSQLYLEDTTPDELTVISGPPWSSTKKALRALVRAGDDWNGQGYPRSEVSLNSVPPELYRFSWNKRYRITGAFGFDANATFPMTGKYGTGQFIAGFQLHGDDGGSPVIQFNVENGELKVRYLPTDGNSTNFQIFDYGPMPKGVRLPYEVIYQPATDATGYTRVAIGNKVMFEQTGPNNRVGDPNGGFCKFGLYDYWSTITSSLEVYIDDLQFYEY